MEEKYETLNQMIREIEKYCTLNGIPMLTVYAIPTNTEERTTFEYKKTIVTPRSAGIVDFSDSDDKISKLNIALNENFDIKIKQSSSEQYIGNLIDDVL